MPRVIPLIWSCEVPRVIPLIWSCEVPRVIPLIWSCKPGAEGNSSDLEFSAGWRG